MKRDLLEQAALCRSVGDGGALWVTWDDRRGPQRWRHYLDLSAPGTEPYSYRLPSIEAAL